MERGRAAERDSLASELRLLGGGGGGGGVVGVGLAEGLDLVVEVGPALADDARRLPELGLLGERVVAEVDRLGGRLGRVAAPGLAPEPLLGERVDRHDVLRVVGQVLMVRRG